MEESKQNQSPIENNMLLFNVTQDQSSAFEETKCNEMLESTRKHVSEIRRLYSFINHLKNDLNEYNDTIDIIQKNINKHMQECQDIRQKLEESEFDDSYYKYLIKQGDLIIDIINSKLTLRKEYISKRDNIENQIRIETNTLNELCLKFNKSNDDFINNFE